MIKTLPITAICMALAAGSGGASQDGTGGTLQQQVADTERAFARTMAERDFEGFVSFLSEEAVFFSDNGVLRGKQQVAAVWKAYYEGPDAMFSWEPKRVEVLDSGTLALSSGPVRDAAGKVVAEYNSIWRLETGGEWRIIFDKGNKVCDETEPEPVRD